MLSKSLGAASGGSVTNDGDALGRGQGTVWPFARLVGVVSLAVIAISGAGFRNSSAFQTVTLVRGPYLQQVGATRAIVVWATREPGSATVEYRTGTGAFSTAAGSSTFRSSSTTGIASYYQHEVVLSGLRAATTYQYDLRVAGVDATPGVSDQFHTAPAVGTGTIRIVTFGDSGTGSTAQSQIANLINAEQFDLAVHNGDIAYSNGTYAEFEARFFPFYRHWLRRVAIFPSIGNHDDRSASATPYRRFFVLPPDGGSAAFPNNAERFYSFDFGPVHFIALDTEAAFLSATRRQAQIAWLTEDLQASQHMPWRIVVFHRPPFSSGVEHGSDLAIRAAFGPLFEQYDVQLVLNGHEHSYERSVPWRTSTNTDRQAVTYVISGAAGAPLYPIGRSQWTAHSRSANHYVRALVTPSDLTIEAVGSNGAVFDRFALNLAMQDDDVSPPQVSIDAPSSGEVLTGVETIAVTATDDSRVEKVDIWVDGRPLGFDLTAPYSFSLDTRTLSNGSHTLQAIAYDIDGKRTTSSRNVTVSNGLAAGDIVLYAGEALSPRGGWRIVADSTAAGGELLEHPQAGAATIAPPLASPVHYVDFTVFVAANTNYRLWLRMKAAGNSGYSDSVWVQSSDTVNSSGVAVFRIGTASATRVNLQDCAGCTVNGWGWQDNGYGTGVLGPVFRFQNGGTQTLRIQAREDGVSIDQVVLSPGTYLSSAPGPPKNDSTILPKN